MGARNPDRIPFASYAVVSPTVGKMLAARWDVQARCNACGLTMRVRLRDVVRLRGPDFRLWGLESHCRDITCIHGKMRFFGKPPGTVMFYELTAGSDPAKHTRAVPPAPAPPQPKEPVRRVPW